MPHRDERWFVQADRFVPERFLTVPRLFKGAWIPFGWGHVCIGQHFAMLEMTLLAAMLQRYWLRLPEWGRRRKAEPAGDSTAGVAGDALACAAVVDIFTKIYCKLKNLRSEITGLDLAIFVVW